MGNVMSKITWSMGGAVIGGLAGATGAYFIDRTANSIALGAGLGMTLGALSGFLMAPKEESLPEKAADAIKEVLTGIGDKVKETFEKTKDAVKQGAQKVGDGIEDAVQVITKPINIDFPGPIKIGGEGFGGGGPPLGTPPGSRPNPKPTPPIKPGLGTPTIAPAISTVVQGITSLFKPKTSAPVAKPTPVRPTTTKPTVLRPISYSNNKISLSSLFR